MSAHVVLAATETLHDAQQAGERFRSILADRFGIEHVTLELESHPCAEVSAGASRDHAQRER